MWASCFTHSLEEQQHQTRSPPSTYGLIDHLAKASGNSWIQSAFLDCLTHFADDIVSPCGIQSCGYSQVWAGNPAKYLRVLSKEEQKFIADSAESYSQLADEHRCESQGVELSSCDCLGLSWLHQIQLL